MHDCKRLASLFAALMLAACSGEQIVGLHIKLAKDGSGTLTARSLVEASTPGPAEKAAEGVTWSPRARAAVVASQGEFRRLDEVRFGGGGLRFAATLDDEQPSLRVYLDRSPDAAWVRSLVEDRATRRRLAGVYDPTGRTREVGDVIRVEFELPGDVVASSVYPAGRGIEANRERRRAFLLLPVESLREGDALVWDVTWR